MIIGAMCEIQGRCLSGEQYAELKQLRAENAALKKSVEYWASHAPTDEYVNQLLAAQHRIKVLRKALLSTGYDDIDILATPDNTDEIDALKKDAERYRFIRDVPYTDKLYVVMKNQLNTTMDAVIDAAMSGASNEKD